MIPLLPVFNSHDFLNVVCVIIFSRNLFCFRVKRELKKSMSNNFTEIKIMVKESVNG